MRATGERCHGGAAATGGGAALTVDDDLLLARVDADPGEVVARELPGDQRVVDREQRRPAGEEQAAVDGGQAQADRARRQRPPTADQPRGAGGVASCADAVAGARHGLDRGRLAELAPQAADRHLDDAAERVGVLVPAAPEQLLGGERLRRRRRAAARARRAPWGSARAGGRRASRRAGSCRAGSRRRRAPASAPAGRGGRARGCARRARRTRTASAGSRRRRG